MRKLIAATFFLFLLTGCSANPGQTATLVPAPVSTASPTPPPTLYLTVTAAAASVTPATLFSPTREGEPASDWNGIPIMPGALTGEGDEEGYVFTVQASSRQVQDYYRLELAALGWQSLSQEADGSSRVLIFSKDASTTLTISILAQEEEALVLLTR